MRVAVVGCGAAGLAATKELSQAGLDVTCFEKADRIGGIWAFENSAGLSPCYRTLHLNTSRARTEYRDYPMPADWPDFPSHWHIHRYFEDYVDAHGFRDRIRFETGVELVRREAGGWSIELSTGETESFDALIVANGHNWHPRMPDPPYPGEFAGEQIHAHDFRDNESFAGRRVMIVGMGNSAMDIAVESSWVAERTFLSVRSGSHVVPKYLFGKPADQITSPLMTRLPWQLRQPLSHLLLRLAVGRVSRYGLPRPEHGLLQDHPTISDTILHRLTHGEVEPKPAIERFDGESVHFADDSSERVDTIVWATGYRVEIPFLDLALLSHPADELPLYKRVFSLEHPDLFFVGLVQSTGSAIPIVEQQAKIVAAQLCGSYALPSAAEQRRDCERALVRAVRRYGEHKRPAMRIDFDGYMREIARERRQGERRALARAGSRPVAETAVPA